MPAESESVHLLTGFRGNGKRTELRRLRRLLVDRSGAPERAARRRADPARRRGNSRKGKTENWAG